MASKCVRQSSCSDSPGTTETRLSRTSQRTIQTYARDTTYSSTTTCSQTDQESRGNQTYRIGQYQEERRQSSKTFETGKCSLYGGTRTTYRCATEIEFI